MKMITSSGSKRSLNGRTIHQYPSTLFNGDVFRIDISICFKMLFNSFNFGIFALHRDIVINANRAFLHNLGYENESELRGKPFISLIYQEDRKKFDFTDWEELENSVDVEKTIRLCAKDGGIAWTHIGIKKFLSETKDLRLGYLIDLTKVKKKYETIIESLNKYQTSLSDVADFHTDTDSSGNTASRRIDGIAQARKLSADSANHLNPLDPVVQKLPERHQFHNLIGQSQKIQSVYNLAENLADIDTTVLITGESGTGKDMVARAIHHSGRRGSKPFVSVNCSALSEHLLESELFGHAKGAFTGAIRSREGRFQSADGGTILLDEIGDISPLIQLKLLRVLQEKSFERVGESKVKKVDVRIIACTNRDLKEKVANGEFREDLYYRLKVVEITLPPLREREGDVALLVDHFQKVFNERFNKNIEKVDKEVLRLFMAYHWPGNVRELEHILEHVFVLCEGRVITVDNLPREFLDYFRTKEPRLKRSLKHKFTDEDNIRYALRKTRGNKAKAARLLGISRQTLYRKIYQTKIDIETCF